MYSNRDENANNRTPLTSKVNKRIMTNYQSAFGKTIKTSNAKGLKTFSNSKNFTTLNFNENTQDAGAGFETMMKFPDLNAFNGKSERKDYFSTPFKQVDQRENEVNVNIPLQVRRVNLLENSIYKTPAVKKTNTWYDQTIVLKEECEESVKDVYNRVNRYSICEEDSITREEIEEEFFYNKKASKSDSKIKTQNTLPIFNQININVENDFDKLHKYQTFEIQDNHQFTKREALQDLTNILNEREYFAPTGEDIRRSEILYAYMNEDLYFNDM